MSVRGDILDTLKAQLETITPANGYASDVASCERDVPNWSNLSSDRVTLWIEDDGADMNRQYCSGNKVRAVMGLTIGAFIPSAKDSVPITAINDCIASVRKLLYSGVSLGTGYLYLEMQDVDLGETRKGRATIRFPVEIGYWFDGDAP